MMNLRMKKVLTEAMSLHVGRNEVAEHARSKNVLPHYLKIISRIYIQIESRLLHLANI